MGDRVSKVAKSDASSNECRRQTSAELRGKSNSSEFYKLERTRSTEQQSFENDVALGYKRAKTLRRDTSKIKALAAETQRTLLRQHTQRHFRPQYVQSDLDLEGQKPISHSMSLATFTPTFEAFNIAIRDSKGPRSPIASSREESYFPSNNNREDSSDADSASNEEEAAEILDEIEVNDWLSEPIIDNNAVREFPRQSSKSTMESASNNGGDEDSVEYLSPFLMENKPLYDIMRQVQIFRNLSQKQQEQVIKALKPAKFTDGDIIVQQGTKGERFYMIARGSAIITKTISGCKQERLVTYLHPGHYFGELALIYDDPRTATVRAAGDVELFYLTASDFQRIEQVHLSLMLQQVPLLSRLNPRSQDIVLSRLKPANFKGGEYILRQGEEGTRFYMITKGEAVVTERDLTRVDSNEKELTRLYEGHVFGEMSLIYQEPRTASVRAIGSVKCLYLTKQDFDECLVSDHFFQSFVREEYVEKARLRAMRLRLQQEQKCIAQAAAATLNLADSDPESVRQAMEALCSPVSPAPLLTEPAIKTTETRKVVTHRLANGQKVVNKYIIQGDLGKGTYGRVKLCQNEQDDNLYAVKIMHKTFVQRMAGKEDSLQDVLRREIAILKKFNHPNIVKLIEVIDDPSSEKVYLVQEYVQFNLMNQVQASNGLDTNLARQYLRDLLSGISYMHFHKIIHRDIKPENILISSEGIAKIADFGTARMILHESEALSDAKGTPAFMAPEMFDIGATYRGPAVDVWSLGATLYMMVFGHPPWLADNEIELSRNVQEEELRFPSETSEAIDPHLKNLLHRMLSKDPTNRISLNDCLNHEFVTREGSEPLLNNTFGPALYGDQRQEVEHTRSEPELPSLLTVSADESEHAIQRIPERIDQSLSQCLYKAHMLIKNRLDRHLKVASYLTSSDVMATTSSRSTGTSVDSSASITSNIAKSGNEGDSQLISAWRHHKRVSLMEGHKNLSDNSRELLLDQKRIALSSDCASVSEIILSSAPSSASSMNNSTSASSNSLTTSSLFSQQDSFSSIASTEDSDMFCSIATLKPKIRTCTANYRSLPNIRDVAAQESHTGATGTLRREMSYGSFVKAGTIYPTRTSLDDSLAPMLQDARVQDLVAIERPTGVLSFKDTCPIGQAGAENDQRLMKRSLSRKKEFLMVTSELLVGQNGDYQTRKIMFQAREHDFSVASSVPVTAKSAVSEIGSDSSRSHLSSQAFHTKHSVSSHSSNSIAHSPVSISRDIDLEGIDFTEISVDDEDTDAKGMQYHNNQSGDDEEIDSDYSDVEDEFDIENTFRGLTSDRPEIEALTEEDEELKTLSHYNDHHCALSSAISTSSQSKGVMQVYVSSQIRENLILGIRTGYAEAIGSRSCMEDKCLVMAKAHPTESLREHFASLAVFGVFDGHNGSRTATLLQQNLAKELLHHPMLTEDIKQCIHEVCQKLDQEILKHQNEVWAKKRGYLRLDGEETHTQSLQPISFSGAAGVFAISLRYHDKSHCVNQHEHDFEEQCPTQIIVGNVGDCRAIMARGNGFVQEITRDHKACNEMEKKRIEASGGFVHNDRLDGILAISRGFGDLAHKSDGHLIVDPDVFQVQVEKDDEFLLLASDGLFDVLNSQQAADFVRRKMLLHRDVQLAAQELILKAQQYLSHDNVSVVIVSLNQV